MAFNLYGSQSSFSMMAKKIVIYSYFQSVATKIQVDRKRFKKGNIGIYFISSSFETSNSCKNKKHSLMADEGAAGLTIITSLGSPQG